MRSLIKNQAGFTVFEMLVSIAIIGAIAAIFIVNVSRQNRGNELDLAVQSLNDQIRELQNLALSSTQTVARGLYATFDSTDDANAKFAIFNDDDSDTVFDAGEEIIGLSPVNLPAGVTFSSRFEGWDYEDKDWKNGNNIRHLLVIFYPPDSRTKIYIRANAGQASHPNSFFVSHTEFSLSNGPDSVRIRINDYGLFEVI